jgi:nucleoside 2-deoxyribosyltransferase
MNTRHQVFLSSTYEDLKEERLEVLKALLELDCIPCGMEYFPASNQDQWSYITQLIDDCDYYVVVVAGKYGSVDDSGISYTQREYEYAVAKGIPTIAFLHGELGKIPVEKSEQDPKRREQLDSFRKLCQTRLCKNWTNVHELGAVVSRSLTQLIKHSPRPGWVKAGDLASEEASREILALRRTVDGLHQELDRVRSHPPLGSEHLAQGDDKFSIDFGVLLTQDVADWRTPARHIRLSFSAVVTWDELFGAISPNLVVPVTEVKMRNDICSLLEERSSTEITTEHPQYLIGSLTIADSIFQTIKVQFSALGLIEPIITKRVTEKREREILTWQLTSLGKRKLVQVKAIVRNATNA